MLNTQKQGLTDSLLSGLAGAAALMLVHQAARMVTSDAPRMDIAGRRAIARGVHATGAEPPHGARLQAMALVGDIISNSLYYSLIGATRTGTPLARGGTLGSLAGLGAVVLTPLLKLGTRPAGKTSSTKAMAFTWYLLGGLAAAETFKLLRNSRDRAPLRRRPR